MPPIIHTREDEPTDPLSRRRIRPGVRKTPEPITEPMKRRKRSRWRRVRRREAWAVVEGVSVLVGTVAGILEAQECLWGRERSMRSWRRFQRRHLEWLPRKNGRYSRNGAGMKQRMKMTNERKAAA